MRAFSTMFAGLVIWSVLMAIGVAKIVTPTVVQTFQTIATALEGR